jgi:hypothetical protein
LAVLTFLAHGYVFADSGKIGRIGVKEAMPVSRKPSKRVLFGPEERTPGQTDELIRQKGDQEQLMLRLRQKRKAGEKDMPLRREEAGVAEKVTKEPDRPKRSHIIPEAPEPEIKMESSIAEALPARIAEITVPVGLMVLVKNGADSGVYTLDWLGERIDTMKDELSRKEIQVELEDVPEQFHAPLEQLLEVEGIEVRVPGTDYAIAEISTNTPSRHYDVAEEIFTIDAITLEKTTEDKFEVHVPASALKDFTQKVLRLTDKKGVDGKTIAQRVEEGEIEVLAMVLSEWARYNACGFSFDKDTESTVVKAVIKVAGIGLRSRAVRVIDKTIEDEQPAAVLLENEIRKIVGEDQQAWDRIMEFMYPGSPKNALNGLDFGSNE